MEEEVYEQGARERVSGSAELAVLAELAGLEEVSESARAGPVPANSG